MSEPDYSSLANKDILHGDEDQGTLIGNFVLEQYSRKLSQVRTIQLITLRPGQCFLRPGRPGLKSVALVSDACGP